MYEIEVTDKESGDRVGFVALQRVQGGGLLVVIHRDPSSTIHTQYTTLGKAATLIDLLIQHPDNEYYDFAVYPVEPEGGEEDA